MELEVVPSADIGKNSLERMSVIISLSYGVRIGGLPSLCEINRMLCILKP